MQYGYLTVQDPRGLFLRGRAVADAAAVAVKSERRERGEADVKFQRYGTIHAKSIEHIPAHRSEAFSVSSLLVNVILPQLIAR